MRPCDLLAVCLLTAASSYVAAEDPASSDLEFPSVASLGVPEAAELEARGARVGQVLIRVDDVFEPTQQLATAYRVIDQLHIATRQETVAHQLLFKSGDRYSERTLAETARALRARTYLKEATVTPLRYNEDNTVDVEVRVHDAWTLSPGISFGRKGGANSTRVKFEDANFLGFGKSIAISRGSDVDRTTWQLAYKDPNLFGSRWALSAARADLSDGESTSAVLEMPFYSFDSRWSLGFSGSESITNVSRYDLGEVIDVAQMSRTAIDVYGGVSDGWRNGWVIRYLAGIRHDDRVFAAAPVGRAFAVLPEDRTIAYPWVGIEIIEDNYRSTRNLNQIGRIEDLYLGRSLRLDLGYANALFGANRGALMLSGAAQAGFELNDDEYLTAHINMASRLESGALRNGRLELDTRYYRRQTPGRVFFAAFSGAATSKLDPEEQLLLGGDNGLRGYPLRYQAGTTRALFTLEERFYTRWQPMKLFDVGAAAFVDAGRTWGHDPVAQAPLGWLADAGVGLRLGSARSGRGNVLHIDLAYPLTGTDTHDVQLLVETRASF